MDMGVAIAAILAIPCILMTLCIAGGRYVRENPEKDDLWKVLRLPLLR